jgi:hypothetical protein
MRLRTLVLGAVLAAALATGASAAPAPAPYFNGFENPGDAMFGPPFTSNDAMFNVTRVHSGTNGITSASGSWHAEAGPTDFDSVFTRYGGYSSVFPTGGYTTSVDFYLDTADSPAGSDIRFDWSSAINMPTGDHRRDFIFSVGTDGQGGFAISASNNAPGWPANPGRSPIFVSTTGWYTFQHSFADVGGVLVVTMRVLNSSGTVLGTWTLSDPTDLIGITVGGNRYGWLVTNAFASLALDNVTRSGAVAKTKDDCKNGGWQSVFRADGSAFKNQGDCIQYVNTGK